jgi:hypothetical protein
MLAAVPVLSTVYIYLIHYIPFIYANFFITIGCGLAIGFVINHASNLGKLRSVPIAAGSAVVAVCILKYVQWCVYIPLVFDVTIDGGERFLATLELLIAPLLVFELGQIINEAGVWSFSVGYSSSGDGIPVSGVMLAFVWITEFAIILLTACIAAKDKVKSPFSEESNDWYSEIKDRIVTDVPENFDDIKAGMETGNFISLAELVKQGRKDPNNYLSLVFYQPPSPGEPYYMTIIRSTVTAENAGEVDDGRKKKKKKKKAEKTKDENLIEYLRVKNSIANELMKIVQESGSEINVGV